MPKILILATIAFAAGIWWASLTHPALAVIYPVAVVFFGAALLQLRRGSSYIAATVTGLFFVAGIIRFGHSEVPSPWDVYRYKDSMVQLQGSVRELPEWRDVDTETVIVKYIIAVEAVTPENATPETATGSVVLTIKQSKAMPRAAFSDKVVATGRILGLSSYKNPGRIDSVASLRLQGITARMTTTPDEFSFQHSSAHSLKGIFAAGRERITQRIAQAMPPGDAAILKGVMLGGYAGIKREVVKDFATTGLVHILSVSGTHIALVAGAVLWLGGRWRIRPSIIAAVAAAAISSYAIFAGLSPPVVRSLVMGLLMLTALGLGREKDAVQALALAALVMLAYQPGLLYDIGFQLSFSATAGLALLYRQTYQWLAFLPKWLSGVLAATIAAQLGALPFMAWYFNALSLSSLLANVLVLPLMEFILIIGIAASAAGLVLPLLANILLVFCALVIGLAVKLTALLAGVPGGVVYLPAMGVAGGGLYYLCLAWFYRYLPGFPEPSDAMRRRPHIAIAAIAIIAVAIAIYNFSPRPVAVHFIDVGQGDATLITTPYGRAILVDTGGQQAEFDVGDRVVVPYLKHYGVPAIDYLILTHGHADHAGGAASVAAAIPVRNIVLPPEEVTPATQALKRVVGSQTATTAYNGQTITIDGVTISMLHTGSSGKERETSSVVRVDYGRHSFLLTGDLGPWGEQTLTAKQLAPGTVLKVAHHGSKYSTTTNFLTAFSPEFAVISAGYNNRFGHPHPDTLAKLAQRNIQVYRTDSHGAVIFKTDGDTLAVEAFVKE